MIECKEKLEILKKLNFLKHGVYSAEDIKKICHIKYQYVDKSIDKFVVY